MGQSGLRSILAASVPPGRPALKDKPPEGGAQVRVLDRRPPRRRLALPSGSSRTPIAQQSRAAPTRFSEEAYLVGQDVHTAIGTSLAVVGGIAAEGAVEQRDRVRWKAGLLLGACGIVGSIPGSLLSPHVPGWVLLLLFSALTLAASISMLASQRTDAERTGPAPLWIILVAGFLTGFLGVGVGFLIVPTMVFAFACAMQTAIATSLLVIALNSFVRLATRFAAAAIDWSVVGSFLAGGVAGNVAAGTLVPRLDQRHLKQIFAVFILLVGLFTAASATGIIPIRIK